MQTFYKGGCSWNHWLYTKRHLFCSTANNMAKSLGLSSLRHDSIPSHRGQKPLVREAMGGRSHGREKPRMREATGGRSHGWEKQGWEKLWVGIATAREAMGEGSNGCPFQPGAPPCADSSLSLVEPVMTNTIWEVKHCRWCVWHQPRSLSQKPHTNLHSKRSFVFMILLSIIYYSNWTQSWS